MSRAWIDRPVFVVGSPRTGTTLLQRCLSRPPEVYRLARESRFLWHRLGAAEGSGRFPSRAALEAAWIEELFCDPEPMGPAELRRFVRRAASQGTPARWWDLSEAQLLEMGEAEESWEAGPFAGQEQAETAPFTLPPARCRWATEAEGGLRVVDKDTAHCWRLASLADCFPEARFLLITRAPAAAIASLINAWHHPRWYFTYPVAGGLAIPGYSEVHPWGSRWWNLNRFPGWEQLREAPLPVVCARQWEAAMEAMLDGGEGLLASGRARLLAFEELLADPRGVLEGAARFAGLDSGAVAGPGLEPAVMEMSPWARTFTEASPEVQSALSLVSGTAARLQAALAARRP